MIAARHLVIATVALAILNGIMSPFLISVFVLYPLWYPNWAPVDQNTVVTLSSLILSTVLLMVTGVPAALHERFSNKSGTDRVSAAIWLGCMVLATVPTLGPLSAALQGGATG